MTPLLSTPLLRAQSDRRVTALAASGHDRAFEEIVERYRRPLQRYLRRLLSEPLAEDVLQATFVRAWQALRAGTEVRELRAWLYRIAHNQALNALRAAGDGLAEVPGVAAVSTEVEVERREELRAALDGMGELPDRQRAALYAVAVADRPHADVAAELGLSDGALRQLLLRARSALRTAATALTPYPLVTWLAPGQEVGAARVAEVAAGAGGAGVAIKAGVAVLAAGAVVAGAPALRDEGAAPAAKPAPAAVERAKPSAPSLEPAAAVKKASAPHKHPATSTSKPSRHRGPSASSGPGPSRSEDVSRHGPDSGEDVHEDDHRTTSHEGDGSGDSGSGDSGSGDSGSSDSGSSDSGESSGSGSSDDRATTLSGTTTSTTSGSSGDGSSGDGSSSDEHSGDGGSGPD